MCEQCIELDEKIEHYRALARRVTDRMTLDALARLIKKNGSSENRAASPGWLIFSISTPWHRLCAQLSQRSEAIAWWCGSCSRKEQA
jgi:hypothetical protein